MTLDVGLVEDRGAVLGQGVRLEARIPGCAGRRIPSDAAPVARALSESVMAVAIHRQNVRDVMALARLGRSHALLVRILGHQLGAALGPRALSADDAAAHTLLVGLDGQQIASRNPHLVHRWRVQGCVDGHRVVETQAAALLIVDVVRHRPCAGRTALRHVGLGLGLVLGGLLSWTKARDS